MYQRERERDGQMDGQTNADKHRTAREKVQGLSLKCGWSVFDLLIPFGLFAAIITQSKHTSVYNIHRRNREMQVGYSCLISAVCLDTGTSTATSRLSSSWADSVMRACERFVREILHDGFRDWKVSLCCCSR